VATLVVNIGVIGELVCARYRSAEVRARPTELAQLRADHDRGRRWPRCAARL
jgi:hypothetical protein